MIDTECTECRKTIVSFMQQNIQCNDFRWHVSNLGSKVNFILIPQSEKMLYPCFIINEDENKFLMLFSKDYTSTTYNLVFETINTRITYILLFGKYCFFSMSSITTPNEDTKKKVLYESCSKFDEEQLLYEKLFFF